jgi:dTDP-4-dehydrorhamnose 3,5-epimerase
MSTPFVPGSGDGVRFDDPAFGIEWPAPPPGGLVMSERDRQYPDFQP